MSSEDTITQDTLHLSEVPVEHVRPAPRRAPKQPGPKPDTSRVGDGQQPKSQSVETQSAGPADKKDQLGENVPAGKKDPGQASFGKPEDKQLDKGPPQRPHQHRGDGQRGNFRKHVKRPHPSQKHPRKKQPPPQAKKKRLQKKKKAVDSIVLPVLGNLLEDPVLKDVDQLKARAREYGAGGEPMRLNDYYEMPLLELVSAVEAMGVRFTTAPNRRILIRKVIQVAAEQKRPIRDYGLLWVTEDNGAWVVHQHNNYVPRSEDFFVPDSFIKKFGLQSGHMVEIQVLPQQGQGCGYVVDMTTASGLALEQIQNVTPFEDLIPYYPTERILLETPMKVLKNRDVSMRVIDALTPIGFGQRGLIVAAPRTGKTVLLQGIANSLEANNADADLIVLLIDERPEEVTDFRRMVRGEVIASTFDEAADNHVHVAEMVIEKARRMVEVGKDVIILLDSITRLARGYNTTMPNSGKILSGGVEASALQKPKRFFGSARNIEDGGSLTIMGTALIETGSKMDEVVFEEFKGTGNMELHLDRALSDKRIFPAINLERSGTRKEELLYHKDEMPRIYALRRAMKGVPGTEAMEMLITRMKKTHTNVEFLMQVNR